MTRLMAWDMCHPRQRWRVSVDRDSPRRHEEKQYSDMRNRIRAMLNVCAWRLGIFLVRLKRGETRKDRSLRKRERWSEKGGRKGMEKTEEREREKD